MNNQICKGLCFRIFIHSIFIVYSELSHRYELLPNPTQKFDKFLNVVKLHNSSK